MNGVNRIVIDLDDTMLDTKRMYEGLIEAELCRFGVTSEKFWKASNKEFENRSGLGIYSFDNHMDILRGEIGVDKGEMEKIKFLLGSLVSSSSGKYLFSDVADFLDSYKNQAEIILLTRGEYSLQSLKIAGLSKYIDLKKVFTDIVITPKNKGDMMDELCNRYNRLNVFIDDSLIQINSVRKTRPDVETMWIERKIQRINKENNVDRKKIDFDYRVSNLNEADDILSEMI